LDPKKRETLINETRKNVERVGRLYPGDPGYKRPFTEEELDEAACSRPVAVDEEQLEAEAEIARRRQSSNPTKNP